MQTSYRVDLSKYSDCHACGTRHVRGSVCPTVGRGASGGMTREIVAAENTPLALATVRLRIAARLSSAYPAFRELVLGQHRLDAGDPVVAAMLAEVEASRPERTAAPPVWLDEVL